MEKSCWWIEGGQCYAGTDGKGNNVDTKPIPNSVGRRSKVLCEGHCKHYKSKRSVLGIFDTDKLIIVSELNGHVSKKED